MTERRYIIPEISAIHLLEAGACFEATDPSKRLLVTDTEQDSCPMFDYVSSLPELKLMLRGPNRELYDAFVRVDFTGIYDGRPVGRVSEYRAQAERLFRPEGVVINFGGPDFVYRVFEGSANMSRHNQIYFVRSDLYDTLREHMTLGMTIGKCQLSKLCAYNGLLFSSGIRTGEDVFHSKRTIVIDNPKSVVWDTPIITVEDDGSDEAVRRYHRVEKRADVEVLEFDGEGLISKELAHGLSTRVGETHHSFQIRMPYIKGVVHEVDFKSLFQELGIQEITDLWGEKHLVSDVDLILTKSMFKGFGWMTENGLSWAEYLERCRHYGHALYISGMDTTVPQRTTKLNYQFLSTLSMTDEEFRPEDLPLGWTSSPADDPRSWMTKTTESAYYDFAVDPKARLSYFLDQICSEDDAAYYTERQYRLGLLANNPKFLDEPMFTKELDERAETILRQYAVGELLVTGDTRYLSDDLMRLLAHISVSKALETECLSGNTIYAPSQAYPKQDHYTLLRSPHIARNEEAWVQPLKKAGPMREKYLSHLHYVLMVDSRSLIPDRLGGADYDGDTVKTIADPLLNTCVRRGYESGTLPLLKIPSATPLMADASDWYARFETAKNTFSSRIGQISNAALRSSVIAYDENSDEAEREQSRKTTEILAILTGLEIDSAKSGVKPDLSEYLGVGNSRPSLFLQYKEIVTERKPRKWYEPTVLQKKQRFFNGVDWESVTSNLEKLPFYAEALKKQTPKYVPHPATDEELFPFAADPQWKELRDPAVMARIQSLAKDYDTALLRFQMERHRKGERSRESDIHRILYLRGQEQKFHTDKLYQIFDLVTPERIHRARQALEQMKWHLTRPEERVRAYYEIMPIGADAFSWMDFFCDFRCSGYRILGDLICDLDDQNRARQGLAQKTDGEELKQILATAEQYPDYREGVVRGCREVISPRDSREEKIDSREGLYCAIALGCRRFAMEVFSYDLNRDLTQKARAQKKKRKGLFRRDK